MQIDKNYIVDVYRQLHQVPEIGFDLPKTLAIVRRELNAIGLPYTEEFGKVLVIKRLPCVQIWMHCQCRKNPVFPSPLRTPAKCTLVVTMPTQQCYWEQQRP